MKLKSTLLIILVFMVATFVLAENQKVLELNLSNDGIDTFEANTGSGFLKIEGVAGLEQIEVKATVVAKGMDNEELEDFINDHVTLTLKKRGNKAVLTSKIKKGISSLFKSRNGLINLHVRVPKKLDMDIDDGSGLIEIANIIGSLKLDDGSGAIELKDIDGNVTIDDGSGSIEIKNVTGDLNLDDGSGSIEVRNVSGDVDIDDNSGSMSVYDIKGSVVVGDGSGNILIDGVDKDVHIKRAGSGGVTIRNVKGTVKR
jgi:hypothetical protein